MDELARRAERVGDLGELDRYQARMCGTTRPEAMRLLAATLMERLRSRGILWWDHPLVMTEKGPERFMFTVSAPWLAETPMLLVPVMLTPAELLASRPTDIPGLGEYSMVNAMPDGDLDVPRVLIGNLLGGACVVPIGWDTKDLRVTLIQPRFTYGVVSGQDQVEKLDEWVEWSSHKGLRRTNRRPPTDHDLDRWDIAWASGYLFGQDRGFSIGSRGAG